MLLHKCQDFTYLNKKPTLVENIWIMMDYGKAENSRMKINKSIG